MNPFKKDVTPFLADVTPYCGRSRGCHAALNYWEIKDPVMEPFSDITDDILAELAQCRFPRSTIVIFDLFLRGSSVDSAEVCVMLAGATEQHRKKAVKRLRKSSLPKKYPGLKFDHWEWPPGAPQVTMMGTEDKNSPWQTVYRSQGYEIRSARRASEGSPSTKLDHISYHIVAIDNEVEQRAVLSHFVAAGGRQYLLAPAHIFLPDELDDLDAEDDFLDLDDSVSSLDSDAESSFDVMLRAGSATPPELESRPASDMTLEDIPSDQLSVFDISTGRAGKQPELSPLSPPGAAPWADVMSLDLDYTLIPVPEVNKDMRCLARETIASLPFEKDGVTGNSNVTERSVSIATPSHGLMMGTLSTRPIMMRLPDSKTFSRLYPLQLPSPVEKGDCGSVVFDPHSRVYGFVVAGSTAGNVAYIVPAANILKDITTRLGHEPVATTPKLKADIAEALPLEPSQVAFVVKESFGGDAGLAADPRPTRQKSDSWSYHLNIWEDPNRLACHTATHINTTSEDDHEPEILESRNHGDADEQRAGLQSSTILSEDFNVPLPSEHRIDDMDSMDLFESPRRSLSPQVLERQKKAADDATFLRGKIDRLTADNEALRIYNRRLAMEAQQADAARARNEKETLKALDDMRHDNKSAHESQKAMSAVLEAANKEIEHLKAALEASEDRIDDYAAQVSELRAETAALRHDKHVRFSSSTRVIESGGWEPKVNIITTSGGPRVVRDYYMPAPPPPMPPPTSLPTPPGSTSSSSRGSATHHRRDKIPYGQSGYPTPESSDDVIGAYGRAHLDRRNRHGNRPVIIDEPPRPRTMIVNDPTSHRHKDDLLQRRDHDRGDVDSTINVMGGQRQDRYRPRIGLPPPSLSSGPQRPSMVSGSPPRPLQPPKSSKMDKPNAKDEKKKRWQREMEEVERYMHQELEAQDRKRQQGTWISQSRRKEKQYPASEKIGQTEEPRNEGDFPVLADAFALAPPAPAAYPAPAPPSEGHCGANTGSPAL